MVGETATAAAVAGTITVWSSTGFSCLERTCHLMFLACRRHPHWAGIRVKGIPSNLLKVRIYWTITLISEASGGSVAQTPQAFPDRPGVHCLQAGHTDLALPPNQPFYHEELSSRGFQVGGTHRRGPASPLRPPTCSASVYLLFRGERQQQWPNGSLSRHPPPSRAEMWTFLFPGVSWPFLSAMTNDMCWVVL